MDTIAALLVTVNSSCPSAIAPAGRWTNARTTQSGSSRLPRFTNAAAVRVCCMI
ncbi:hypothetical protein [Corynebacterium variabile]|uniref:hypothetical protein n=1 Tax=Corynebacterium variabile TaxID=1727 RepID=UPI0002DDBA54|nr:hypothetical protein [Corynebacterium variabile]